MKVLIACECSGIVRNEFSNLGHDAWSCDLQDSETPGQHIKDDVLKHLNDGWDLMIAHPPCTYLTIARNPWKNHPTKGDHTIINERNDAKSFFMKFITAPITFIAVENPVGLMSKEYRKPDQIIQPINYGHGETKATCLWLKNLPALIPSTKYMYNNPKQTLHELWLTIKDKKELAKIRSRTFPGIAKAMAEQWTKSCRDFVLRTAIW